MAFSRAQTEFKLAQDIADEAAENARVMAELEKASAAEAEEEDEADPALQEAEDEFR